MPLQNTSQIKMSCVQCNTLWYVYAKFAKNVCELKKWKIEKLKLYRFFRWALK